MRVTRARHPASEVAARWSAMRMLERRPHAVREIERKLGRKGYEPAAISAAVDRLKDQGLLDDAGFAAAFVRSRLARKPAGRRLLAAQLRARGVDREVADTALAGAGEGESDRAAEAVRRYLRRRPLRHAGKRTLEAAKERAKLAGWLVRQGFDSETVRRCVRSAGADEPEE